MNYISGQLSSLGIITLILFIIYGCSEPAPSGEHDVSIREHVEWLTSDELEGRLAGSAGEATAANYIADQFLQHGLIPAGDEGTPAHTLGGWQLAVSQYSEYPDVAADVAFYLAGYESQLMRATDGSMNPTIAELYEHEDVLEANPFMGDLYDVFINAVARPSTISAPNYAEVSGAFVDEIHPVLRGRAEVYEALEYLEISLQEITGLPVGSP